MLTERDIDKIHDDIVHYGSADIYYISHQVERRESYIDEVAYKSRARFKIQKLKIKDISNAYFEYLKFKERPDLYMEESEEILDKSGNKVVYYYTVPKPKQQYTQEFNPRIPSAIFGRYRKIYINDILKYEHSDPSPVKPVYTNVISYNGLDQNESLKLLRDGELSWKYRVLDHLVEVDAIKYKYLTSDWFILDIKDYCRLEQHMVNVKQKSAFFINDWEALSFADEIG